MVKPPKVNVEIPKVRAYIDHLPVDILPHGLRPQMSALLAGSAGWGVKTSASEHFDWDLHLLFPDAALEAEVVDKKMRTTLDDQLHSPKVFGQFHGISWLKERLTSQNHKWWPLYHWICENGTWISQTGEVADLLQIARERFERDREDLLRAHYVIYNTRRLDMKSADRNGQTLSAAIYAAEASLMALQSFSLLRRCSYPYPKWLGVWVCRLDGGPDLVKLVEAWLEARTASDRQATGRAVDAHLTGSIFAEYGPQDWVTRWWEYIEN